jgi:predicted metalloprotease
LQADCYAGVWTQRTDAQFHILQKGDIGDAIHAAGAVGDDTIEKRTRGYAVPDSFTHGTAEQRTRWFKRGLARGNMDDCDTFSVRDRQL